MPTIHIPCTFTFHCDYWTIGVRRHYLSIWIGHQELHSRELLFFKFGNVFIESFYMFVDLGYGYVFRDTPAFKRMAQTMA